MAKPGSAPIKPLTLRQVEELAREHGAGDAWDALTPAGRKQWAARYNREHVAAEKKRRAEEARQLREHSKMVDRFMAQFVGDPEPRKKKR